MGNLIKLSRQLCKVYGFEFDMKHRDQLTRIEDWHDQCNSHESTYGQAVSTPKVPGRKSDKSNVR